MIIASNFKTNHTRGSTISFCEDVDHFVQEFSIKSDIFIFPPATALGAKLQSGLIGAQNAYPVEKGSFTGEIGLEQLSGAGIKTILIGHSERRHILKESNELILEKFRFFKEQEFNIMFCVGEPLDVREKGLEAVIDYVGKQLEGVDLDYDKLIVAYEPVWAIGTGVSASIEDIKSTHKALKEQYGIKKLLYGGSVKLNNIEDILKVENVDGVLVGTASWVVDDFCKMLKIANGINS
jgi:triosephosphate isomerase